MRFNKQELLTLAAQSAHKYEKEGILVIREKSEGFFRRTETFTDRWFRLAGNLLFYLRTTDHWSEPVGVIVLENYTVQVDHKTNQPGYHFFIGFQSGGPFWLSANTEMERSAWLTALSAASFSAIRAQFENLKVELQARMSLITTGATTAPKDAPIKTSGYVKDVSESPLCEISVSCDNLRCDSHGRAPTPKVFVHVRNSPNSQWLKYACTEVTERTSNPVFLTTITFRESDGLSEGTEARFTVCDVRERTTGTQTVIGILTLQLGALKCAEKMRLPIRSPVSSAQYHPSTHPGFITIGVWNLEREERSSTESTPCRATVPHIYDPNQPPKRGILKDTPPTLTHQHQSQSLMFVHRRTQSLPPRLGCKLKVPLQNNFGLLLSNPFMQTYRFHSGLGGDIFVHEIMAESKLTFLFPIQLLSVWIGEEKELVQEMMGLGELREPWHSHQVQILERHLWLINLYTLARQGLTNHEGSDFKQSSAKGDPSFQFVPLNLHLQRMWAQNDSLHKSGFHDTLSVGAFTAYSQGYQHGGLLRLLEGMKRYDDKPSSSKPPPSWIVTNKINMTYDSVQQIKRLRKEIVERMQVIMKLAKERKTYGMHRFVEEIYHRCRLLLTICDQSLVEEAFEFYERQKLTLPASQSLDFEPPDSSLITSKDKSQVDEGIESPNSPMRTVVDLFKKRAAEQQQKQPHESDKTPDSGVGLEDIVKSFLESPSSNYYRPSEEPEPWDLTQLNIEASVISLNSKVKVLCGQGADIQHHSLRPSSINRVHSLHSHVNLATSFLGGKNPTESVHWRKSLRECSSNFKISLPLQPFTTSGISLTQEPRALSLPQTNNNCGGLDLNADWSEELRSSVKKLRLAMDGLLKTSRLAHSIFRLQESNDKSQLGYIIKYRRDICFSHALTSVVIGLMDKMWCRKPDPSFLYLLTRLGPLVSFHAFLTYYSHEAEMFNDMIVAVEDLKTVEFVLMMGCSGRVPEGPLVPKVLGSRSGLKVILPVPESVFSVLPVDSSRSASFVVTPVFFNIGINEQASIADRLGNVDPQEKSNLDSFARLNEYYCRYKKLTLPVKFTSKRNQTVEPNLDVLLDKMHGEILSKKKKNVELIHISGHVTRALMGLRFSSCKSGKDRTSMSVTLEQAQILSREYDLAETEFQAALDAMRSEGCRRENTLKNIGQRKYAFNSLQAFALPKLYRPPPGTFGNVQT